MAVSKRLRFEIFKRDGHACQYCGAAAPDAVLQIDHITPVTLGGTDQPSNLVTACADCNSGKGSSSKSDAPVPAVDKDSLRWAKAIEQVAEDRRRYREAEDEAFEAVNCHWPFSYRPDEFSQSVRKFVRMGLNKDDLLHILERAAERTYGMDHCWRYFCKVAWSDINVLRERAAAILRDEPQEDVDAPTVPAEAVEELLDEWDEAALLDVEQQTGLADPDRILCIECDERWEVRNGLCEPCLRAHYDNYDGAT